MAEILAIDYGEKRTGLAHSDAGQIFAFGLCTLETPKLLDFLQKYCKEKQVSCFVLGYPKNLDGTDTHATNMVEKFCETLQKTFPLQKVILFNEMFTSKMAMQSLWQADAKKKHKQNKALIDKLSATILLQSYLAQTQVWFCLSIYTEIQCCAR